MCEGAVFSQSPVTQAGRTCLLPKPQPSELQNLAASSSTPQDLKQTQLFSFVYWKNKSKNAIELHFCHIIIAQQILLTTDHTHTWITFKDDRFGIFRLQMLGNSFGQIWIHDKMSPLLTGLPTAYILLYLSEVQEVKPTQTTLSLNTGLVNR